METYTSKLALMKDNLKESFEDGFGVAYDYWFYTIAPFILEHTRKGKNFTHPKIAQ